MKYFVGRKSKYTGKVEFKKCKTLDNWCSLLYVVQFPDRVWQFSRQGAKGIVKRYTELRWLGYEYFIVPVEDVLGKESAYGNEV